MDDADKIRIQFMKAFENQYEALGMKGLSAASVAAEAGYSRSSFYRSFESVYDLLTLVEKRATPTREFSYLADNSETVTMEEFTNVILEALVRRERLIRMLTRHSEDNRFYERFSKALKPAMRGQIERVYILEPADYDMMAEYITAAKVTLMRYWASNDMRPEEIARLTQVTDAMFEGLLWERVDEASRAQQAGEPYERTPLSYFAERYDWIAHRLPDDMTGSK